MNRRLRTHRNRRQPMPPYPLRLVAAATGAVPAVQTTPKPVVQPAASTAAGHGARPAAPPRPAAPAMPPADVAGKTTSIAAPATRAVPAAPAKTAADSDDTSPLLTRRVWI